MIFHKIDYFIRKMYFKYFTGLSLLFLTISPRSETQNEKKEKGEQRAETMLAQFNGSMMNQLLDAEENANAAASLAHELYLEQANSEIIEEEKSLPVQPMPQQPKEVLMKEEVVPQEEEKSVDVLYENVLDRYVVKIEHLILIEQDYITALKELDKLTILDPLNIRARKLKETLNEKIASRLSQPLVTQKEQSSTIIQETLPKSKVQEPVSGPVDETISDTDAKEAALKEVEGIVLEERREILSRLTKEEKKEPSRTVVNISFENMAKTVDGEEEVFEVPVEPLEPLEPAATEAVLLGEKRKKFTEKVITPTEYSVDGEEYMSFSENPFVRESEEEAVASHEEGEQSYRVLEEGEPDPVLEEKSSEGKDPSFENVMPKKVQNFILRGKKYFRQRNYSLALVSFSKARQYDVDGTYAKQLEGLIAQAKERLADLDAL